MSLDKVVRESVGCTGFVGVVRVVCCFKWVRRGARFRVVSAVCGVDGEVQSWVVSMVDL